MIAQNVGENHPQRISGNYLCAFTSPQYMNIRMRYSDRLARICTRFLSKQENCFLVSLELNLVSNMPRMGF